MEQLTLRVQIDQRKQMYKIVKKTNNGAGGWARFGGQWYLSTQDAQNVIDRLVNQFPDQYKKDN